MAKEIGERGGTAIYNRCDVTNLEEIRDTIGKTAEAFGGVDILVNNAAGFGGGKTFDRMTYEEWDRLIRINLTGAYMFTNEVLPYMVKSSTGRSVWSARARPLAMISPILTMRPPRPG